MITNKDEAVQILEINSDLKTKFEHRVKIGEIPDNELCEVPTPCHYLNRGTIRKNGYMVLNFSNVKLGYHLGNTKAHILAFLLYVGARLHFQINHICNNPLCVNPEHLILGNSRSNIGHGSATKKDSTPHQESWKLSVDDRIKIRNLHWLKNWSVEILAEEFTVTINTIYKVLNSKELPKQKKDKLL